MEFCSAEYWHENIMVPDTIYREIRKQSSSILAHYDLMSCKSLTCALETAVFTCNL